MTRKEIEAFLSKDDISTVYESTYSFPTCYLCVYLSLDEPDKVTYIEVDRIDIFTELSNYEEDFKFFACIDGESLYMGK